MEAGKGDWDAVTTELLGCAERREQARTWGTPRPHRSGQTADKAVRSTVSIWVTSSQRAPALPPRSPDCSSGHPDPRSSSCGLCPLCILSTEHGGFCLDGLGVLSSFEL